jgi:hypothetical protein
MQRELTKAFFQSQLAATGPMRELKFGRFESFMKDGRKSQTAGSMVLVTSPESECFRSRMIGAMPVGAIENRGSKSAKSFSSRQTPR